MQVNDSLMLASIADRPQLDAMLATTFEGSDVAYEVIDAPSVGALGLPAWTSVILSAQHGSYERLQATVREALSRAGIATRFEEPAALR